LVGAREIGGEEVLNEEIEIVPIYSLPKEFLDRIKNIPELVLSIIVLTKEEIKQIYNKDL
jgi:hypothetical protein